MSMNFLEQLTAEWLEYQGYFVRRNVLVGKRPRGGHECELDVVGFHPTLKRLRHIEPSMDSNTWAERTARYTKKFEAGRKYIPALFQGFEPLPAIEQIALFGYGGKGPLETIGGGQVVLIRELGTRNLGQLEGQANCQPCGPGAIHLSSDFAVCGASRRFEGCGIGRGSGHQDNTCPAMKTVAIR